MDTFGSFFIKTNSVTEVSFNLPEWKEKKKKKKKKRRKKKERKKKGNWAKVYFLMGISLILVRFE